MAKNFEKYNIDRKMVYNNTVVIHNVKILAELGKDHWRLIFRGFLF